MVYVLEVNPRASRTVPYLSKATGVPLAKVAARVMAGQDAGASSGLTEDLEVAGVFVKSPVFPFVRFPGVDTILGPEMKSTGEVMGGADDFGVGVREGAAGGGQRLPRAGHARSSASTTTTSRTCVPIARDLARARLHAGRDARHGGLPARARPRRRGRLQGQRGPAERRRRDRQPQDRAGHQHAARPRVVLRRPRRAPRRDDARRCRASRRSPAPPRPSARSAALRTEGLDRPRAAGVPRRGRREPQAGGREPVVVGAQASRSFH